MSLSAVYSTQNCVIATSRDGADALAYPLSVVINKIIESGSVPAAWKLAEICPIFKKDDPQDKSNYRPVSILVIWIKFLRSALHANSLIILVLFHHRFCLGIDGATAVRRYFYV